ncbi:MAG: PilZ domain-containing protein [Myxococcota bacterium]
MSLPPNAEPTEPATPPRRRRISDTIEAVVVDDEEGARDSQRVPMLAEVVFLHPKGLRGVAVDASRGGMRIVLEEELEIGQRCIAIVQLESGEKTHERMEVVWVKRTHRGWEVGFKFAS